MKKLVALLVMSVLLSTTVAAYHFGQSTFSHTRSSERVSISENEFARSRFGGHHFFVGDDYTVRRSRTFDFSRDFENTLEQHDNTFFAPYNRGLVGQTRFAFSNTGLKDYRPFSDYYAYSPASPYYNSRFANYYGLNRHGSNYVPPYGLV